MGSRIEEITYECFCGKKFNKCSDLWKHQYKAFKKGDPEGCIRFYSTLRLKTFRKKLRREIENAKGIS